MPLPLSELVSLDDESKTENVKVIHLKECELIEKKNRMTAQRVNKARRQVIFEPNDWVWVHLRKKRFPTQRKSKLDSRGDDLFQVLKRINDNAYKIDLSSEYNVLATFDVFDLSPFDIDADSRTNLFEKGGNDICFKGQTRHSSTKGQDGDFSMPMEPMTRARAKRLRKGYRNLTKAIVEKFIKNGPRRLRCQFMLMSSLRSYYLL